MLYGQEIEIPLNLVTQPSCEGTEEPEVPYPESLKTSPKLDKVDTGEDFGVFRVVNLQPFHTNDTVGNFRHTQPHTESSESRKDSFMPVQLFRPRQPMYTEHLDSLFDSFSDHDQESSYTFCKQHNIKNL
ncbi:hypothetical protein AOLI_G00113480 [Acnodon oligacanthus]